MAWIGYLLILMAGVGGGLYGAHRLTRRRQYVGDAVRLLSALEQQMTCTALPMAQLWRRLAASDAYGRCRLLTDTAAALDRLPFDAAFGAAVERAWTEDLLTPAGRQLLTEFGAGCGRYDMERQSTHIRLYTAALTALDEELAAEAVAKGRLYRVLGAAGGAALVLLLL